MYPSSTFATTATAEAEEEKEESPIYHHLFDRSSLLQDVHGRILPLEALKVDGVQRYIDSELPVDHFITHNFDEVEKTNDAIDALLVET